MAPIIVYEYDHVIIFLGRVTSESSSGLYTHAQYRNRCLQACVHLIFINFYILNAIYSLYISNVHVKYTLGVIVPFQCIYALILKLEINYVQNQNK